ncbi:hypothetical protein BJ123_102118 [Rhodopseudomonas thermotolerans]|uniref:PAS domain-containing protein n=2 Tax=Rhodopseudomonas TaxID=1073 RepID=A0A336JHZ9_9BRAD|nr:MULTISPECIES: hypothetical protein [Rhodopseudomonas]RED41947.1 hypothetical protein BJ125_102116 [Rhodopseudomonas pentothenatexigens]REG07408.1 hypothetical protein BJ123_102118 [Rhodopseudomonas thermotolerans]SSW89307.1 hypothetical protein SAMN05892882_102116 [Rhodopseudomonas pentothenatexigens]
MFANPSSAEVVRHVPHRWLINQWARGGRIADPALVPFAFEPASIDMSRSIITRVVGDGEPRRYQVLHYGSLMAAATGLEPRGRYLDEVLPSATRDHVLMQYELCRRSRKPVYSISHISDVHDVPVDYEKLLLPFTGADGEVHCIFTTSLLISTEGRFERDGIFAHGDFPSANTVVVYAIDVARADDAPSAVAV